MSEFKPYIKKAVVYLRPVTQEDIDMDIDDFCKIISLSPYDALNGSPKLGDMIARNSEADADMWLVAESYFKNYYEECVGCDY